MNRVRGSVLLTAILFGVVRQPSTTADLVITHVSVTDATGAPPAVDSVVVRKGAVDALLVSTATAPPARTLIDGTGRYLIPGLWDMHVHLAARPEPALAEHVMLPLFLANGIVGVRDMGGPLERVLAIRQGIRNGTLTGDRKSTRLNSSHLGI